MDLGMTIQDLDESNQQAKLTQDTTESCTSAKRDEQIQMQTLKLSGTKEFMHPRS